MAAAAATVENTKIPVNLGVVVDLDAPSGKTYLSCIKMALQDFYASHAHFNTRLVLHTRNSKHTVVGAASAGSLSKPCSYTYVLIEILYTYLLF